MLRAGDGIMLCVFGLLCVGVVMVNSAGLTIDPDNAVTFKSIVWSRSTLYMALALACLAIASHAPLSRICSNPHRMWWAPAIVPLSVVALLLVYAPVVGHEVNGSSRWILIPGIGFTIQPSEIAKWGVLITLAWFATRHSQRIGEFGRGILPGLLIVAPVAALIGLEDLGTGVLIAGSACVVLIGAGARLRHLLAFAPLGLLAVTIAVLASPYRIRRLTAFLDPFADPEGSGYHMIQSLVAIANGQGFGRGLGFGLQKFGYLPEDRTDFLFAVICEELGLAGAAFVLALLAGVVCFGISIVRRQTDPFIKLLGLGIITTFGCQAMINLFVVTGLAPTKGIALPLLSSGGTGWSLTAGALGLLIAMDKLVPEHTPALPDPGEPAGGRNSENLRLVAA